MNEKLEKNVGFSGDGVDSKGLPQKFDFEGACSFNFYHFMSVLMGRICALSGGNSGRNLTTLPDVAKRAPPSTEYNFIN